MAPLTVQRQHLHRPRADPGDRAQPPPAALVIARRAGRRARAPPRGRPGRASRRGSRRRSKDSSSAGAVPASTLRRRQVAQAARRRRPSRPSAGPARPRARRSIAAARSYSISCSQIAQRERLERLGAPPHAQPRAAAQRAADQRIAREAPQERAQVLVHAEREAHPRDPVARRPRGSRARAPNSTRSGAVWATRTSTGSLAVVQQPLEHPAADGAACRPSGPPRQAEGPARDLDAQLLRRSSTLAVAPGAEQVHVHAAASGCRRSADGPRRWRRATSRATPEARDRRPGPRAARRAAVAAVYEPHDGGAGHEPAGGRGGGLHGRGSRAGRRSRPAAERARDGRARHRPLALSASTGKRVALASPPPVGVVDACCRAGRSVRSVGVRRGAHVARVVERPPPTPGYEQLARTPGSA